MKDGKRGRRRETNNLLSGDKGREDGRETSPVYNVV
jgi:hypothetical protein